MVYYSTWVQEDEIKLLGIADIHIGSPQSHLNKLINVLKTTDDRTFFLFLGDILDNAIIDSVGDVYEQTDSPQGALKEFIRILDSIKERTLGVIQGNHEHRTKKRVGIDILEILCTERNIPYSPDILVLDLAVGTNARRGTKRRIQYTIVAGHGYSASRSVGGKITANGRIIDVVVNGDIYLTAHTHQPSVLKLARFEADTRNKKLLQREFFLVTVPSWLGYEEYAAQRFMHPSAGGYVEIQLSGMQKNISILMR